MNQALKDQRIQELISLYNDDTRPNDRPLDAYQFSISRNIKNKCFNIYPSLVLPDITDSTIGHIPWKSFSKTKAMKDYLSNRTLLNVTEGISHFSKYWNVRFSNNKSNILLKELIESMPSFQELVANSPSKLYLH